MGGVGFPKNQNRRENCLKRRPWIVDQFKGGRQEKAGWCF